MVTSLQVSRPGALIGAAILAALGALVFAGVIEDLVTGAALRHPLTAIACGGVAPLIWWGAAGQWREFAKPTTLEIASGGLSFVRRGRLSHWDWSEIDDVAFVANSRGGGRFKLQLATNPRREVVIAASWIQNRAQIWEFYVHLRALWRPKAAPAA